MSFTGSRSDAASRPLSIAGTPSGIAFGLLQLDLWSMCSRPPFYIAVVIYIFFPYFSNVVVGDPVAGQALIGYLNAAAGAIMALTIPFLGAIADKGRSTKTMACCHCAADWFGCYCLMVG